MKKFFNILFLCLFIAPFIHSQEGIDIWTTSTTTIGRIYAMAIDETSPNIMYAGGLDQGVWKTTNSGANWTQINNGLLNTQLQAIAICKNNPQVLYAGTAFGANDGVYKTTNGGSSWTRVVNGITEPVGTLGVQALMVHPNDPNIAWVAIFGSPTNATNGLYKTTDGGANWFHITNGIIPPIYNFLSFAMSPANPNIIYTGSSFIAPSGPGPSRIYKSTNGGANWFVSSNGLPSDSTQLLAIRTMQVSSTNPNVVIATLFMNTANGGFYLSTDAGANWTKKHNGLPSDIGTLIRSSAIRPLFDNQFYVGLDGVDSLGVWGTTNGGNSWFDFNGGTMLNTYVIRALVFSPAGNHTLFAGRGSTTANLGGVYEFTFSFVPVELVSFSAEVFDGNVNLSWMTTTELNNYGFQIERRNSETSEWTNIGFVNGNGNSTETKYYSFSDNSVPVGNYIYRLKQMDYSGSFEYSNEIQVTILEVLNDFTLNQNYPNPFNPSTRISFSLPENSFVTLKVYDVLGNEVETLVNRELSAGSYEVEFISENVTSGVYFYNLTAGKFSKTMKMILSK